MYCSKCGNEVQEGQAFCGKCGAPVGAAAGGVGTAGASGAPSPKKSGAKIGAIVAAVVVVLLVVIGFATSGFGLGGVQPKEAVDVPAVSREQQTEGAEEIAENPVEGSASGQDTASNSTQGATAGATVKSAVEAYTWDELSQISAEIAAANDEAGGIEVAKKYNLCTPDGKLDGTQVKSVTLSNGTELMVQIAGFCHDDKTNGGKAGITFIFDGALASTDMDANGTNDGGWENAPVRSWLNSEGLANLPADLQKVIVPVDKLTNNIGETDDISAVSVTSDYLWLFSFSELQEVNDAEEYASILGAEGTIYKLFVDAAREGLTPEEEEYVNNKALVRTDPPYWWGRTPNPDMKAGTPMAGRMHYFVMVSYDGYVSFLAEANGPNIGVIPGFCI